MRVRGTVGERVSARWVRAGAAVVLATVVLSLTILAFSRTGPVGARDLVSGTWYGWGTEDVRHSARGWFLSIQAAPGGSPATSGADGLSATGETCQIVAGQIVYTPVQAVEGSVQDNVIRLIVHDQASDSDYFFQGAVSEGELTLADQTGVHAPVTLTLRPGDNTTFRAACAPVNA